MTNGRLSRVLLLGITTIALVGWLAGAGAAGEPRRLYVGLDHAQVVDFPKTPFSKVSVTNPGIADVYVVSPTQILLSGRAAGVTSLLVFHAGQIDSFEVVVHPAPTVPPSAPLVPEKAHTVEVQRGAAVSQQVFAPDQNQAWVELGAVKAEPGAATK